MNESITVTLKKIWSHLTVQRRRQFGVLLLLAVLTSFAEVISLGAVLPFITVITQPDKVLAYPVVAEAAEFFSIESGSELVLLLVACFGLAAILAGGLRLLLLRKSLQLGNTAGVDLSIEVYKRTLNQPYSEHIQSSSSEIISGITQKIDSVTGVLVSLVTVVTSAFLFVSIVATLLLADPFVALLSSSIFGVAYGFIAWITRKRLVSNSHIVAKEQSRVVKTLQEGLGSIRDVLLDNTQNIYVGIYGSSVRKLRRASAENDFIKQAPRFAMEALGLLLISAFVIVLNSRPEGVVGSLPIMAMLALGAQRLLPIMQTLYSNWSAVKGNTGVLVTISTLLDQPMPDYSNTDPITPLRLEKSIVFKNISFVYTKNSALVLDGVTFNIAKGSRVGIIGSTGSGKSTMLDLLMGLLKPTKGMFKIDGNLIKSDLCIASWRRSVAHVPQAIFLSDATISENIAFGIPFENIDFDRVQASAKKAQIADFIEGRPEGYDALVGERGVRLSGGQRQRIGIARALYKNASVLVFDEATSALDNETEHAIMETINGLSKDITTFMIAHRLTTLRTCSQIIELKSGVVNRVGTYQDLIADAASHNTPDVQSSSQ
jgi:ATP-binding cassette, subfamily B, bacterial PglK